MPDIDEKFNKLHSEKPEIYEAFKRIIKKLQDRLTGKLWDALELSREYILSNSPALSITHD